MESIRQAVERARAGGRAPKSPVVENLAVARPRTDSREALRDRRYGSAFDETELNLTHLLSKRIVACNGADLHSRPYDILRTQVLQSMAANAWKLLGITSPTPGCGKTVTAVNLAFSIARQLHEEGVLLVDMDLQKPQIANCLGLTTPGRGLLDLLEGQTTVANTLMPVRAADSRLVVLPTSAAKVSSDLLALPALHSLLLDFRRGYKIVIVDLPPILTSDDVIAVLPKLDCIVLVAAVGISKASQVEDCTRHLQRDRLIRVVLNMAADAGPEYYYY